MGADHPGDIAQLTRIAKPNIGLVTAVGEVPVHVQYYASPQEVAYEKSQLPRSIASDGLVVLNYDDQSVLDMREHTRAHVATFGFSQNADIFVEDYTYALPSLDDVGDIGMYVRFRVHVHTLEVFLPHIIAKHQLYPIMGAIAIAWHLGISQENIIDSLKHISLSPGRMQMAEGFHDIFVIDDTYNSSPLAAHAALDVLKELGDFVIAKRGVGRKIAILGDMRELGDYSIDQHRQLGARAGAVADLVVAVGDMRGYITEGALTRLSKEQVISFEDADRAASAIAQYLEPHDLVLIKGSRSVHMEKVVNILAVSH
jgi:UDP-N-acetylmuramoyl-tripeptide--D-alanyl-D-alanine ligase